MAPYSRLLLAVHNAALLRIVRPYVRRELPGWGYIYRFFVGDYRRDKFWQHQRDRWIAGKMHGYEMSLRIGGWSNRSAFFLDRFYDLPTQLLIQQVLQSGDIFVDVGANEGMISLVAARCVGSLGRVIAFEPNPAPRAIFERNILRNNINNVEIRPTGLGDLNSVLDLFVPEINSGEGTFTTLRGLRGRSVACPVTVGDEALKGVRPQLIKIDVEGFEAHVLRGLQQTIERARPAICIELVRAHLARDGETPETVIEMLDSMGYKGRKLATERHRLKHRLVLREMPVRCEDGDYLFTSVSTESSVIARNAVGVDRASEASKRQFGSPGW